MPSTQTTNREEFGHSHSRLGAASPMCKVLRTILMAPINGVEGWQNPPFASTPPPKPVEEEGCQHMYWCHGSTKITIKLAVTECYKCCTVLRTMDFCPRERKYPQTTNLRSPLLRNPDLSPLRYYSAKLHFGITMQNCTFSEVKQVCGRIYL